MRLLDREGRLAGRLNLLDAAALLGAALAGMAAYHALTDGRRAAPPFALPENSAWVDATLQLPPGEAFMAEHIEPGDMQHDPRTGAPLAEVVSADAEAGILRVRLRLYAQRDTEGRWFYRDRLLVPGRELDIETGMAVIRGKVSRMAPPVAP